MLFSPLHPAPPPHPHFSCAVPVHTSQVFREHFEAAVLRSVAGIEKKRSILQGVEKTVVARHEVG